MSLSANFATKVLSVNNFGTAYSSFTSTEMGITPQKNYSISNGKIIGLVSGTVSFYESDGA